MNAGSRALATVAAMLAFLGIALSAAGSHLANLDGLQGAWEAAIRMHLFNAAGLLGLAALSTKRESALLTSGAWIIVVGVTLFAGSIYLHVSTGQVVRYMAPAGGVLMMLGWLLSALAFVRKT